MIESYQLKHFRANKDFDGVKHISLNINNLSEKEHYVSILGDAKNTFKHDEVVIKNCTPYFEDDDNNLTILKNYVYAIGYVEIVLFRLQSTNVKQVSQIISVTDTDANGQLCTIPIITQYYFSASQFQTGILDVPYRIRLSGHTSFSVNILPYSTYHMTLFCGENKIKVRNAVDSFIEDIKKEVSEIEHYIPMNKSKKKKIMKILKD